MSLVLQTQPLGISTEKKMKPKKVMGNSSYFVLIFPNFYITKTMCVPYYSTDYMQMVNMGTIIHYSF